jgi:hypothetical protein
MDRPSKRPNPPNAWHMGNGRGNHRNEDTPTYVALLGYDRRPWHFQRHYSTTKLRYAWAILTISLSTLTGFLYIIIAQGRG